MAEEAIIDSGDNTITVSHSTVPPKSDSGTNTIVVSQSAGRNGIADRGRSTATVEVGDGGAFVSPMYGTNRIVVDHGKSVSGKSDIGTIQIAVVQEGVGLVPTLDPVTPSFEGWRFELADSETMESIVELDKARGRQLQLLHNRAGGASFALNSAIDYAQEIKKVKTCIKCIRNGKLIWSGPVWTIARDLAGSSIQVVASGWFKKLDKRIIRHDQIADQPYQQMDSALMIFKLLEKANLQGDTGIIPGLRYLSPVRTRQYTAGAKILDEINALSDIENGVDMRVDPETRKLDIYWPRLGQYKPDVVYGYNWGPENLSNVQINEDADQYLNRALVQGKYGSVIVEDIDSQADIGVFEETFTLSDVTDPNILFAYGGGEVAIRLDPRVQEINPLPQTFNSEGPRLFDHFDIGDIITLGANKDSYVIDDQPIRIFGATVDIEDTGNEKITGLQTRAS